MRLNISDKVWRSFLMMFGKDVINNEFGSRFIDIGLENIAVAAACVVE